jgi:hypothetical protein
MESASFVHVSSRESTRSRRTANHGRSRVVTPGAYRRSMLDGMSDGGETAPRGADAATLRMTRADADPAWSGYVAIAVM